MDTTQLLKDLQADLAEVERQMDDANTLSHSDQHILDQEWDDIMNQIDALEQSYEAWQAYIDNRGTAWAGEDEWPEEEEEEEPRQTVTIAPPPPPVTRTLVVPLAIRTPAPATRYETEEDYNDLEDDRPDCSRCAGCAYCEESAPGYNEADEF